MFFVEHLAYAWGLTFLALIATGITAIVFAQARDLVLASVITAVGVAVFYGLVWLGLEPIAQFVPWLLFGYILADVLLPVVLAFLPDWKLSEGSKEADINTSHENGVQYPCTIIPFPGGK